MAGGCQSSVTRQVFDDPVSENLPPTHLIGLDELELHGPRFIATGNFSSRRPSAPRGVEQFRFETRFPFWKIAKETP